MADSVLQKINKLYLYLIGIPKTVYFNFKYFNFATAIKLPVLISHRVVLLDTNGKIHINCDSISTGMIKIGFGSVGIFDSKRSRTIWQVSGNVVFNGTCHIGHGSKISVNKNGSLFFGNNFTISAESSIVCNKKISFGDDCLLSWNNLIMDTDFHKILDKSNKIINEDKEITIGNKVWIGCRCTILKGTSIKDNIVIGANSCISGIFNGSNQVIGGNPPKILKNDIDWIS